jgi:hypothetical protein
MTWVLAEIDLQQSIDEFCISPLVISARPLSAAKKLTRSGKECAHPGLVIPGQFQAISGEVENHQ